MTRWMVPVLGLLAVLPVTGAVLWGESFDNDAANWVRSGDQQPASVDAETKVVGSALVGRYRIEGGQPQGLVSPVGVSLAGARAFRFQLRTSAETVLILVAGTPQGGFIAVLPSKAGAWQPVEMSLDRFRPADDVADTSLRLEAGQIQFVGVFDASGFLGTADANERSLWIDEWQVVDEESANAYSFDGRLPFLLDDFQADLCTWIPFAGAVEHDPEEGVLTWSYPAEPGPVPVAGVMTPLGHLPEQASHLYLTLRVERATQLAVVLTESKGPDRDESNYVHLVNLAPGEFQTIIIPLSELILDAEHSSDENGRFDLDQVGMLLLADIEVAAGGAPGANTIVIDEVELVDEG